MSLHDVDKGGDRRHLPKPNQTDEQHQRMAHGTTQFQRSTDGTAASVDGLKMFERYILAKYNGFNKAVFGFLNSTNKFGLKVAKDGFDVLTTGDANLIFNSDQNVFKIVTTGTTTISGFSVTNPGAGLYGTNSNTTTVAHGLSTKPLVLAFLDFQGSGSLYPLPYHTMSVATTTQVVWYHVWLYVDNTNIHFGHDAETLGIGTTFAAMPLKYYVLQETAG